MSYKNLPILRKLTFSLLTTGLLVTIPTAQALNSFSKNWDSLYPNTLTSTGDADCAVCHGSSTSNLNAYGAELCRSFDGTVPADITNYLLSIEGVNSDSDSSGSTNLQEIEASAQPGWTTGANNPLYGTLGANCVAIGTSIGVPSSVPLPYDPPANGDPVAVPGGPYSGYVNVPITFDGSGSYDSDGGAIASYTWNFGDSNTGTGMTAQHTYSVAGTYSVNLTVVDDEGVSNSNSTTAIISAGAVLDLDIAVLKATKTTTLGKSIAIQLSVENPGTVLGQALATVVGVQNGVEVYRRSLNVYDNNSKGSTSFNFEPYKAVAKGTITWNATISDVDPDIDQATVTTVVK
jgi:PKD repeat protein